jgi:hypothetical protein
MQLSKKIFFLLLLAICTTSVFAKTITVLSCQKNAGTDTILEVLTQIETGVMDILFDSGHIVTSEQPILYENAQKEITKILKYYKSEGSVQYLVYLEFGFNLQDSKHPELAGYNDLTEMYWKIVRTIDNVVIAEKKQDISGKIVNFDENVKECRSLGKQTGIEINTIIMNE